MITVTAAVTSVILQIALPANTDLTEAEVERITGYKPGARQIAWLKDHEWPYELTAKGEAIVGRLYANLRLAGLHPQDVAVEAPDGGFDLSATR